MTEGETSVPSRSDKWYLGGGAGLIWAPPFPRWVDVPGFWDEAHLYQYAVGPVFTVSVIVDREPLAWHCRRRTWTPAQLVLDHHAGPLRLRERRVVVGRSCVAEYELRHRAGRPQTVDLIVWTAVGGEQLAGGVRGDDRGMRYTSLSRDRHGHCARIVRQLTLHPGAQSWAAVRAEASGPPPAPRFELTPFYDAWGSSRRLDDRLALSGLSPDGVVFIGLQRRLRLAPARRTRFAVSATMRLGRERGAPGAGRASVAAALRDWERFRGAVPAFRCSDRYLERHWWHRWFGLRLSGVAPGAPNYRHPTVCEGIGYFHVPIAFSAPCHVRELRWVSDPEWARGVIRTFLDHQRPGGALHGRIYADHLEGTDFYHADWGGAVLALDAVHPEPSFRADVYAPLARYAAWLLRTRDREGSGLIDVANHYETGQEYMSRYQAVDPGADRRGWRDGARLKGVDVTVYAYRLFRALEHLARESAPGAAAHWGRRAERTAAAVRRRMWDPARGMFSDTNPATGRRTGVEAAVCFYPYLTDLATRVHVAGLGRALFAPDRFWTPFPVPSSSVRDPQFDPDARWKGKRHNCPWNGRVWPMTTAHVIEALARVVRAHRPEWAPRLGHLLHRFVRMMTFAGDADRPNCFEHYHPYTGRAAAYRGVDDYLHSWVNDLIVSHVMGVLPHGATGVTIQPLRLGVARASLVGVAVAGHRLDVRLTDGRFAVAVDGRRAGRGRVGEPLTIAF